VKSAQSAAREGQKQKLGLNEAYAMAVRYWREGNRAEAGRICRQILAVRPVHQGARHLNWTLEHGVQNLTFTAIHLFDPNVFSIGDYSYGVPQVLAHNQPDEPARLSVGNFCTIGHGVEIILGAYHRQDTYTIYPFSAPHMGTLFASTRHIQDYSWSKGGVAIGHDVWIGAGAKILSGVRIGTGAVVGAGSVVSRDIGPYEIWAGNPAQFVRRRFDEATAERLLRARWWDWPKDLIERHAREIMRGTPVALAALEAAAETWRDKLAGQVAAPFEAARGHSGVVRLRRCADWQPGRPVWVVLHGSLGSIGSVQGIEAHLTGTNLLFLDLPGCGGSTAPAEVSVGAFADELLPVLSEHTAGSAYGILGVSFGGSLALEIARRDSRCARLMLLDTPFSAAKLWHNHAFLRGALAGRPDDRYLRDFALNIYGVTPSAAVEREYWHLLDGVRQPVTVVTGSIPMGQPRQMPPVPCCLDDDDLRRLSDWGATVERIEGGHDLINDNPRAVAALVQALAE